MSMNGVPSDVRTMMDAWFCGKEMAFLLTKRGPLRRWHLHRARVWAKRWRDGYERGFEGDSLPGSATKIDGHWYLGRNGERAA